MSDLTPDEIRDLCTLAEALEQENARLQARVADLESDPRLALTDDDLAAIAGVIAKSGLFLSDTHVKVYVAFDALERSEHE